MRVLIAAVLAIAAGCTIAPARLEDLNGRRIDTSAFAVDVALNEEDRTRVDAWRKPDAHYRPKVLTGPAWAVVFTGDPRTAPVFKIDQSTIFEDENAQGYSRRVTYVVEATLIDRGKRYPVHASGFEQTSRTSEHALPAAVDACSRDAAQKVAAILARADPAP